MISSTANLLSVFTWFTRLEVGSTWEKVVHRESKIWESESLSVCVYNSLEKLHAVNVY